MISKNKKNNRSPVWILSRIAKIFMTEDEYLEFTGDTGEIYEYLLKSKSRLYAQNWFRLQILKSLPSIMCDYYYRRFIMIRNFVKVTGRILISHKVFSFINISGLAFGIAACIFMLAYITDELSYDSFHEDSENIYRVVSNGTIGGTYFEAAVSSPVVAQIMKEDFPEVEDFTRFLPNGRPLFSYENKNYYEENMIFAEKNFFQFFSFELLKGDPATVLEAPYSLVISQEMASKYFGNEDPIGKVLKRNSSVDVTVTGILKTPPPNSHFTFEAVQSLETINVLFPNLFTNTPSS